MQLYREPVLSVKGEPIAGVEFTVKTSTGDLATLFAEDGTPTGNPVVTNQNGEAPFKAENGNYSIEVAGMPNKGLQARTIAMTLNDPKDITDLLDSQTQSLSTRIDNEKSKSPSFSDRGASSAGDSTSAIQLALNAGYALAGSQLFTVSAPLKLPNLSTLRGDRAGIAMTGNVANVKRGIKKTTNTPVAVVNFQSAVSSSVNCILYTDPAWVDSGVSYPQKSTVERMSFQGNSATGSSGIYVEQGGGFSFRELDFSHLEHAIYAKEMWLTTFDRVHALSKFTVKGGTSHTYSNCWTGSGPASNGGYDFSSLSYSTMNSCGSDHALNSAYRFAFSKITLNGCGCENSTTMTGNSGTAIAFDGANEIVLNNFNCVPIAGQVIPIFTLGPNDLVTFNGGSSSFGVSVNCPDIYIHGDGATAIFNDYVFVSGSRLSPVIQFANGVTTSKVIVSIGGKKQIYTSDGTGATLIEKEIDSGTFSPTLTFGGASTGMSYAVRSGTWQKNGKLITVSGRIALTAKGSASGVAALSGWPFVPLGDIKIDFALETGILGGPFVGALDISSSQAVLNSRAANGDVSVTHSNFTDSSLLRFTFNFAIA